MGSTSSVSRSVAIESDRHERRETDRCVGGREISSICKLVLWTENTAPNVAAVVGCSVRQAERYLSEHNWSGDALAAIVTEILARHRMRNVKIVARR